MTILVAALAAMLFQAPVPAAWTWTLYEGEGPLVLANEVPDTPQLKTTLECEPGSGVARVSLYDSGIGAGFANVSAGDASATAETDAARAGRAVVAIRTDHPVFSRFVADGALTVTVGEAKASVEVQASHLPKLRRFAELCGG